MDELPAPIKNEDGTLSWMPIVRVGKFVPWGYDQDPNDKDILIPNIKQLELLEEAKRHLKRFSYRQVANWLSESGGRYITHTGLRHRILIERKRQQEAFSQRKLIKQLEAAIEKAKKIEGNYRVTQGTSQTGTGED